MQSDKASLFFGVIISTVLSATLVIAGLKAGITPGVSPLVILFAWGAFTAATRGPGGRRFLNIAQVAGSAGMAVTAGVIFVAPMVQILHADRGLPVPPVDVVSLAILSLAGALIGYGFVGLGTRKFLSDPSLPAPEARACEAMIETAVTDASQRPRLGRSLYLGLFASFIAPLLVGLGAAVDKIKLVKNESADRPFSVDLPFMPIYIGIGGLLTLGTAILVFSGAALRLVGDPSVADDLAQEAWIARAERRGAEPRHPRAWLAGVVRHLAQLRRRGEGRRKRREEGVARAEGQPSALEVSARLELSRVLSEELSRLEEPFRTAVVLRYLEELDVSAVAAATGVPPATVRTRCKRGLDRLRERLDRRDVEGAPTWRSWALALAPSALPAAPLSPTAWILTVMSTKTLLAAGLALLALCLAWGLREASEPGTPSAGAELGAAASAPAPAGREDVVAVAESLAPSAPGGSRAVARPGEGTLRLTVRGEADGALRPLAVVRVEGEEGAHPVDAEARLELVLPAGRELWLLASEERSSPGSARVRVRALERGEVRALTVRLASPHARPLHGRVLDDLSGLPIEGARVTLRDATGPRPQGPRSAMTPAWAGDTPSMPINYSNWQTSMCFWRIMIKPSLITGHL